MFDIIINYRQFYLSGIGITILLSALSLLIGSVLGILLAIMKLSKSKILNLISLCYIELLRGTPLFVQLSLVYIGIPIVTGISISPFIGGLIAVGLNSAAYVAEIIRSGIQSVDKGQSEAALSLGLNQKQVMKKIILPQALKTILPALGNEFVSLTKETSIVATIGLSDLYYAALKINATTYMYSPFVIAAILYFLITFTLSRVLGKIERKLSYE
ncbi:MAG: amino acid ABC transporter permease [Peptoniphilaceae bacterium]|nr:amino acid ABC transporter permease [Peptoniphilaceae bacterium]MDY3738657.1 amino acid ABC transporter permease [Peptoniphilaceae bacterium]